MTDLAVAGSRAHLTLQERDLQDALGSVCSLCAFLARLRLRNNQTRAQPSLPASPARGKSRQRAGLALMPVHTWVVVHWQALDGAMW